MPAVVLATAVPNFQPPTNGSRPVCCVTASNGKVATVTASLLLSRPLHLLCASIFSHSLNNGKRPTLIPNAHSPAAVAVRPSLAVQTPSHAAAAAAAKERAGFG